MDEQQMREIAREELDRFLDIFATEIAYTPIRADGNLNARDFLQTLEIVKTKTKSIT